MMKVFDVFRACHKAPRLPVLAVSACLAAGPAGALTNEDIFTYRGPDRQQMLEKGARREGTVVIYSGMIVNQALRPLAEAFRKKYPFIDLQYWRGDSNQVVAKVNAEVRAKALVADIVEGSGLTGEVGQAGVTAPFYSSEFEAYPKEFIAPDQTFATVRLRYLAIGYNTKRIPASDAPKTWEDLLDPKWKGKMAWNAQSDSSGALITITALRAAWGEQKAEEYFKKLAGQNVAPLAMSNRAVMDRVIEGEYLIGVGISTHHPLISASKGAPSTTVLADPVPALSDTVNVLKDAPHPHAAMLLVDFLLSKEGQTVLQKAQYFPARPDIPAMDSLKAADPRAASVPVVVIPHEMLLHETPRSAELFQKYFK